MIVDFNLLNQNSRVWVFQSTHSIDEKIIPVIKKKIIVFLDKWKSHQKDFKSSFLIKHNTFIIIAADESNLVSGCSIDTLVNFIKELEHTLNLQLLDKMYVKYIFENKIKTDHINDFKILCKNLKKNKKLIVFNNLIKNIFDLKTNWKVDVRDSWHKRYIP
jgi:hypothetical protein